MTVKVESTTDTAAQVAAVTTPKAELPAEKLVEEPKPAAQVQAETETEAEEVEEEVAQQEGEEPPKKKKVGGFQKRINKISQERDYWRDQALANQKPPEPPPAPPAPAGKPDAKDFDSHSAYVEAISKWSTEQALKAHEAKADQTRQQAQQAEVLKSWDAKVKAARTTHADFDDVMSENVPISLVTRDLIMESEYGAEIAYHLGTNQEEALKLAAMAPLAAARYVGALEAKLESVKKPEKAAAPLAPKPKPVDPAASGRSAPPGNKDPEKMSFQEFKRWRASQSISH